MRTAKPSQFFARDRHISTNFDEKSALATNAARRSWPAPFIQPGYGKYETNPMFRRTIRYVATTTKRSQFLGAATSARHGKMRNEANFAVGAVEFRQISTKNPHSLKVPITDALDLDYYKSTIWIYRSHSSRCSRTKASSFRCGYARYTRSISEPCPGDRSSSGLRHQRPAISPCRRSTS
jgi:hypothetical protein